jgi:hypothetical protein
MITSLINRIVLGILRHLLSLAGGALLAHGVITLAGRACGCHPGGFAGRPFYGAHSGASNDHQSFR